MKLYEISSKLIESLLRYEEAETQEEQAVILESMQALTASRDEKLESCSAHIKNMTAESEAIENELNRLKAKHSHISNKIESLKRYVAFNLGDGEKWTNGVHSLGWRKSEALEISDPDSIPDVYKRTKVVTEPNKTLIKQVIKEGGTIGGCSIQVKQNLQVK